MDLSRGALSVVLAIACTGLVACGGDDAGGGGSADAGSGQRFPTITKVETSGARNETVFSVTIRSPYDSPERYADGWRVLDADDSVLDETELGHDHAEEQPFTRESEAVDIPEGVDRVFVEPSDTDNGFGGKKIAVEIG